jgi:excisionase family DNA binding protein
MLRCIVQSQRREVRQDLVNAESKHRPARNWDGSECRPEREERPLSEPLLLRPTEAARLLGISRSNLYELLAAGEIPTIHIGRSVRIPLAQPKD